MAINALRPDVAEKARSALAELDEKGIPHAVTSTLRTSIEQSALYAQGRAALDVVNARRKQAGMEPINEQENSYKVTNCDGIAKSEGGKGRSPHQLGIALDVVPLIAGRPAWPAPSSSRWADIAAVMKKHGFEWGGDWADFPDFPHYQVEA